MSTVYFIKPCGFRGPIKIGCSMAPLKRAQSLRAWCPFPLEILATIPGDGKLERRFHSQFAHLHEGSEWFTAAPELIAAVEEIKAGTFDLSALPPARALARKPRDLAYLTPAWCYKQSVARRLQRLSNNENRTELQARFVELLGGDRSITDALRIQGGDLAAVKDQFEPALAVLSDEFGART